MTKMSKQETTVEKTDAPTTETEVEIPEVETEVEDEVVAEKNTETEIDFEAEIAKEEKRGKPDPKKAVEAFKERKEKRVETEDPEEDDRPLTRKDIAEIEARTERKILLGQALTTAKGLAANDKEAELVIARWNNRTFPEGTPLSEQIEEVYTGLPHVRKRLIGERNEAIRALKNKDGVNRNPATTHRDGQPGTFPKASAADVQAFRGAGYVENRTTGNWEKKLPNGDTLVRDSKTKQTRLVKKPK